MNTLATITIKCATCPETIDLCYSHESLGSKTLPDDIKHDATISSDWYCIEGLFYCDACGESLENDREQAKSHHEKNSENWRIAVSAGKYCGAGKTNIPYADAIREKLNNGEG